MGRLRQAGDAVWSAPNDPKDPPHAPLRPRPRRTSQSLHHHRLRPSCGRVGLIRMGNTEVLCAASVETRVPPFLRNTGLGWVTAEYGMLPERPTRAATAKPLGASSPAARRKSSG